MLDGGPNMYFELQCNANALFDTFLFMGKSYQSLKSLNIHSHYLLHIMNNKHNFIITILARGIHLQSKKNGIFDSLLIFVCKIHKYIPKLSKKSNIL